MKFRNAMILDSSREEFFRGGIVTENGKIVSFEDSGDGEDLRGALVIPGLIDTHTHGRVRLDFASATEEELQTLRISYLSSGVTTVVPSLASATLTEWLGTTERIRNAGFEAIHYEGRYLNPVRRGAHAPELLSPLNPDELPLLKKACGGMRAHITLAPELPGGEEFVKTARRLGFTCGMGHTNATYGEAQKAISWGINRFTHTFNAMSPLHHRDPGTVGAALLSEGYAELICDGIHLHPATVLLASKLKSPDRVLLITDSMEGAGCPDGDYGLAGNAVHVRGGKALLDDGTIAGSTLSLLDGVRNYAEFAAVPFARAVNAATRNPAVYLGMQNEIGTLKVGNRADFLVLSPEKKELLAVYKDGKRV